MDNESEIIFTGLNKECRFCFGSEKPYSPLITPCRCKGTQAYIHIHCLDKWQKIQINRPWSSKFCNVCRHPYSISSRKRLVFSFFNKLKYSNFAFLIVCIKLFSAVLIILYTKVAYNYINNGDLTTFSLLFSTFILLFTLIIISEYILKIDLNISRLEIAAN